LTEFKFSTQLRSHKRPAILTCTMINVPDYTMSCKSGIHNLGDARGLKVEFTWVHLYQWGDTIDVKGDADTKRLGTPGLNQIFKKLF